MVVVMGGALVAGATIVTLPRFELESFFAALQAHGSPTRTWSRPSVLALARSPLVSRTT
jgi:hypothetical protein